MLMNNITKEFIEMCNDNIKSFSKKEKILEYLPIENEKFKIIFTENKLFFHYNNKTSYIYPEKDYFSNIEIMKRIGIILGVELEKEDIFSIVKFSLSVKQILVRGEV